MAKTLKSFFDPVSIFCFNALLTLVRCTDLKEGRFHKALESAKLAEMKVERAFFEPSMVAMVYFPDEHKVAVYLPLLGPVAVPLIMSAIKELKAFRKQRGLQKSKAS
jgi:phosphatidylinositol glycan class S